MKDSSSSDNHRFLLDGINALNFLLEKFPESNKFLTDRAFLFFCTGQKKRFAEEVGRLEGRLVNLTDRAALNGLLEQNKGCHLNACEQFTRFLESSELSNSFERSYIYFCRGLSHKTEGRNLAALQDLGYAFCLEAKPSARGRILSMRADILNLLGHREKACDEVRAGLELARSFEYLVMQGYRFLQREMTSDILSPEVALFHRRLGILDFFADEDYERFLHLLHELEQEEGLQVELSYEKLLALSFTGVGEQEFVEVFLELVQVARERGHLITWAQLMDPDWGEKLFDLRSALPLPDFSGARV